MAYILNLVLGYYLTSYGIVDYEPFDEDAPDDLWSENHKTINLKRLVKGCNSNRQMNSWADIHYPCKVEHFEIVDRLPEEYYTSGVKSI
jgi:hypothetical protein